MTARHIIDIEKTNATEKEIEKLELVLCAKYPATIITDGEGSMYSIYIDADKKPRGIESFAEGALSAIEILGMVNQ